MLFFRNIIALLAAGGPMIYPLATGATTDPITLHSGDRIEFAAGAAVPVAHNISVPTEAFVGVLSGASATLKPAGISIPRTSTGAQVQNIAVETHGDKTAAAISLGGVNARLLNIAQIGCGSALRFDCAVGMIADLIYGGPNTSEYAIKCFGGEDKNGQPNWNRDNVIRRFDVTAGMGVTGLSSKGAVHALRAEHCINFTLGCVNDNTPNSSLPGLPGFAWRAIQASDFDGCAVTVTDGSDCKFLRGQVWGKWSIGPYAEAQARGNSMHGAYLDGMESNGLFVINPGTLNTAIHHSTFRALQKQPRTGPGNRIYDIKKLHGWAVSFGAGTTGTLDGCLFIQATRPTIPNGWTATNCRWASKWDGSNAKPL